MKIGPWHSRRRDETVYHDNTQCTEGRRIDPHYLAKGTGGNRPICPHCARINADSLVAASSDQQ